MLVNMASLVYLRRNVYKQTRTCLGIKNIQPISSNVNRVLFNRNRVDSSAYKNKSAFNYVAAVGILVIGLTYAAVPLYRVFCQAFSYGGTTSGHDSSKVSDMKPNKNRTLKIKFNADTAAQMAWKFKPQQSEVKVIPGETVLAFYTATNPQDVPICGVSTYNVIPFEAGQYFNKIQCFCFEEQMLGPHEQVDMPVFFFIDPEFTEDPKMEFVNELILSYTFFEAKEGMNLPIPSYIKKLH